MHENWRADLRADVLTADETDFDSDVKGTDEKVDVDVGLKNVKDISVDFRVTVGVKLDEVVD